MALTIRYQVRGVVLLAVLLATAQAARAATVQLPRTGQKLCYDTAGAVIDCAGTGQDGEIQAGVAWPDPRFTDNGDGTVTDNVTGLMWQQMGSWSTTWGSASTPGTAQHYCATVSTAGHAGGGVLVRDVGTQLAELRLVRLLLQRRRSELPR